MTGSKRANALDEFFVCEGVVRDGRGAVVRKITGLSSSDEDGMARLVSETQGSALVFCPNKASVENIAKRLATLAPVTVSPAVLDRLAQEAHVVRSSLYVYRRRISEPINVACSRNRCGGWYRRVWDTTTAG